MESEKVYSHKLVCLYDICTGLLFFDLKELSDYVPKNWELRTVKTEPTNIPLIENKENLSIRQLINKYNGFGSPSGEDLLTLHKTFVNVNDDFLELYTKLHKKATDFVNMRVRVGHLEKCLNKVAEDLDYEIDHGTSSVRNTPCVIM